MHARGTKIQKVGRQEKVWGPFFFFLYLWLPYPALGLWGGVWQSPSRSHLLSPPRPGWPDTTWGAEPPFSLRRTGASERSAVRRLPGAVGGA